MTGRKRIAEKFSDLRERGEKGLITYVTAGYPSIGHTLEIVRALAESGSDLIEIGIPFSDPIADGPVIQGASYQALSGGLKLADIFQSSAKIRSYTSLPLLFMTYYNPVLRFGIDNFIKNAADSGIDGFIVPDLPVEEDDELREKAGLYGLSIIPLAAPTSTESRLEKISAKADGFIYCVSVTGVTGSGKLVSSELKAFSERLRHHTPEPLAVGFGIADPETARRVSAHFDAVVVGSAIVRAIEGGGNISGIVNRTGRLTADIKDALRSGGNSNE
ncbi:MAG: tryptophan synthase subunit alpha [Desulfocucumaceae bacterium]